MSATRPTHRDRLEKEYLALAAERARVVADFDRRLLAMQRALGALETRRLPERVSECGPREDAVDRVANLVASPERRPDEDGDEFAEIPSEFGAALSDAEWRMRALRMSGLVAGLCAEIVRPQEAQPKLVAHVMRLAADLPGALSMRELARVYALSPERVRQRVEEFQRRFNLPANRHNKSAAAVESYRVAARMRKGEAA